MLITAPMQYDEIVVRIPNGKVTTVDRILAYLAKQACSDVTCQLKAGIFTNICAHASVERIMDGIPCWRTLKAKGELNQKYPEGQKLLLEMEGHIIAPKSKRYYVSNFEKNLFELEEND